MKFETHYRVTNVVGDTGFVDFSIMIASLYWVGGDFLYPVQLLF